MAERIKSIYYICLYITLTKPLALSGSYSLDCILPPLTLRACVISNPFLENSILQHSLHLKPAFLQALLGDWFLLITKQLPHRVLSQGSGLDDMTVLQDTSCKP